MLYPPYLTINKTYRKTRYDLMLDFTKYAGHAGKFEDMEN